MTTRLITAREPIVMRHTSQAAVHLADLWADVVTAHEALAQAGKALHDFERSVGRRIHRVLELAPESAMRKDLQVLQDVHSMALVQAKSARELWLAVAMGPPGTDAELAERTRVLDALELEASVVRLRRDHELQVAKNKAAEKALLAVRAIPPARQCTMFAGGAGAGGRGSDLAEVQFAKVQAAMPREARWLANLCRMGAWEGPDYTRTPWQLFWLGRWWLGATNGHAVTIVSPSVAMHFGVPLLRDLNADIASQLITTILEVPQGKRLTPQADNLSKVRTWAVGCLPAGESPDDHALTLPGHSGYGRIHGKVFNRRLVGTALYGISAMAGHIFFDQGGYYLIIGGSDWATRIARCGKHLLDHVTADGELFPVAS